MLGAKKTLDCPSCGAKLRVPVKTGKTLRITCPSCRSQFDIAFNNPLTSIFQWNKSRPIGENLASIWQRFLALPGNAKFVLVAFVVSGVLLLFSLVGMLTVPRSQSKQRKPQPIEKQQQAPKQDKGLLET